MTDTHTPPYFALRLAQVLGVPANRIPVAEAFWAAQAQAEGGAARWNPLNTTYSLPGSWLYNSAGVRNYVSASQGAQATAATLTDGHFPGIAAALRSGRGLCGNPSLAGEFLTWSGNGYSGVC